MQLINVPSTIVVVDPKELIPHALNEYFFSKCEDDAKFEESIKERGIIEMPLITTDKRIISGHRRIAAAIKHGFEQVQCQMRDYEGNEDKEEYDLIAANIMTRGGMAGLTFMQQARVMQELRRLYGNDNRGVHGKNAVQDSPIGMHKTIQEMIGDMNETVSRSTIGRLAKIATIPDEVADAMPDNMSMSALETLSEMQPETQTMIAEHFSEEKPATSDEVARLMALNKSKDAEIREMRKEIDGMEERIVRLLDKYNELEASKGASEEMEMRIQYEDQCKEYKATIATMQVELRSQKKELDKALRELEELNDANELEAEAMQLQIERAARVENIRAMGSTLLGAIRSLFAGGEYDGSEAALHGYEKAFVGVLAVAEA